MEKNNKWNKLDLNLGFSYCWLEVYIRIKAKDKKVQFKELTLLIASKTKVSIFDSLDFIQHGHLRTKRQQRNICKC